MKHTATEQPISWFADRETEENLKLQPDFQRRLVWANRQRSNLIESILMGLPIPEIYMQIKTDASGKSEYIVVDGQQRISAILDFVGVGTREPFELSNLDHNSIWSGCMFDSLTDEQKGRFYGHTMAVRLLQDATYAEIEDLFRRLNRNVIPLNFQELRNATYRGPLLSLSQKLADDPFWSESRLASPEAIRRMRDIEFVSDLLIGVMHGPRSGSPKTLDDYYAAFEDYEPELPGELETKLRFSRALELIREIFPKLKSTRWANRSDFYSLFVAMAHLLRDQVLFSDGIAEAHNVLTGFEAKVKAYQDEEEVLAEGEVEDYVDAIRRGSTDQHRRGVRHQVLISIMSPCFRARAK